MSKPTKRSKVLDPSKVQVYNALTRQLGCMLPVRQLEGGARRPPRQVSFKPGNNEIDVEDWKACKANSAFAIFLREGSYPSGGGKHQDITPLVEGYFDKGQSAAVAALTKKVEAERVRQSTGT